MNVGQLAASTAMQTMLQGGGQGLANAIASTGQAALALVAAEAAVSSQVSANGMVGSIVNTFA
ncbi:hypothetical protein CY652_02665 [Burkholderia sp. WAC0059]|uniref:hypothetical protein n=1 Tax=Burkholderia sp. WAC0059 TaxID=2066022 RepID=UPI000C7EB778|nr:hypothetical protein [Burkholderia sp. WAC0059]PLZ03896.1 hypothetical protein CY652_02665 [Burkholderia sp. WAC0059]